DCGGRRGLLCAAEAGRRHPASQGAAASSRQGRLTRDATVRRVEIPPSTGSPGLVARTSTASRCWFRLLAGKPLRRLCVRVTVPFAPVRSSGPANWLYGIGVAKTDAPCTGLPPHAVTRTCNWMVCVPSVTNLGASVAASMLSRAGSWRSEIWTGPPPAGQPVAGATGTSPDGAETNCVVPLAFAAATDTRKVLPAAAWVSVYVAPV